ncbi:MULTISPECIES: bestrophin family protein [Flectobacillus]|uniref:Bestrophin family ion channel n=1 Tax=Flectobacillus roseus TaxID=502259 RepID=A0ABT6YB21_9BACT|nr:bestrophin family ion channel [Flectobacillus roseus]MDI9860740.1 bestrophin family ion channel [Flectobacillus roseus]
MILRKVFNPLAVIRYMFIEITIATFVSVTIYFVYDNKHLETISLPFSIAAILGSALAIFIAFRNNNAYSRWWEARTVWGNIINNSRIFARQIIVNAENAAAIDKASVQEVDVYKKELVYRQIAFAHALRLQLRQQNAWEELKPFLSEKEYRELLEKNNKANFLIQTQGFKIKEGIRLELLGAFDNISIEPTLAGFSNYQGACERIKNTPLLRQYHYFTKLFLYVFMVLLPFCLIADFSKMDAPALMIPTSILISFVFGVMGKVGEVNENPFENQITDIPMSSMCNTIERDLKEMLIELEIPAKLEPKDGFIH